MYDPCLDVIGFVYYFLFSRVGKHLFHIDVVLYNLRSMHYILQQAENFPLSDFNWMGCGGWLYYTEFDDTAVKANESTFIACFKPRFELRL
jgi:hypothetical protein